MRALIKPAPGPGLELTEVPEPSPGFGEVKIRVMRTGLCGTDLHLAGWDDFAAEMLNPPQTWATSSTVKSWKLARASPAWMVWVRLTACA